MDVTSKSTGNTYRLELTGTYVSVALGDKYLWHTHERYFEAIFNRLRYKDYRPLASAYEGTPWEHTYDVMFATEIEPQDPDAPKNAA